MGRFNHEAAAIDPRTGIVYMTEDRDDSLSYRFLPDDPGSLRKGGRLPVLAFHDKWLRDSRNWAGQKMAVGSCHFPRWITPDNPENPPDDLHHPGPNTGPPHLS